MAQFRPKARLAAPLVAALAFSYATAPDALAAAADIQLSEVVTNGDDTDWVELYNSSDADVDIAGWTAIDGGKNSTAITFPANTTVPAKGYYVFSTDKNTPDGSEGFGLGKDDKIKISDAEGKKVDSYSWTEHPRILDGVNTSWIRVGDQWQVSLRSTKGAGNEKLRVVVNELVSNGDKTDWVELANPTGEDKDISGWTAVDDKKTHTPITFPAGTTIPAGGYYVFDTDDKTVTPDGSEGFGLGNGDEIEIKDKDGNTVDILKYPQHAKFEGKDTSWGRIPNMYGDFVVTGKATRGAANVEAVSEQETIPLDTDPWPYDSIEIKDIDLGPDFNIEDMSGIDFDAHGRAWIVNNGESSLWALDYDEATDTYSVAGHWELRYPDGTGKPDAEGITVGHDGALYVATERDNSNKKKSRPSVLRFELDANGGTVLNATDEWSLASYLPADIDPNGGPEAISFIPGVGTNLYAVGVEATGSVYFLELGSAGATTLVQEYKSPFAGVMALDWDQLDNELRVLCDEACQGQSILLKYDGEKFVEASKVQSRPAKMAAEYANEGYAKYSSVGECAGGKQEVTHRFLWSDDSRINGTALRGATAATTRDCEPEPGKPEPGQPGEPGSSHANGKCTAALAGWGFAALALIPLALLQQAGFGQISDATAPARDAFAAANVQLQQQFGVYNAQLAQQAKQVQDAVGGAGPLVGALVLGTIAAANIARACVR